MRTLCGTILAATMAAGSACVPTALLAGGDERGAAPEGAFGVKELSGGWEFRRAGDSWRPVSVPHDWSAAGPFDRTCDVQVVAIVENGETKATEKTGRTDDFLWSPIEDAACGDRLRYLPGVADGYFKEHRGCDYGQMWPVIVRKIKEELADEDSFSAALQLGAALGRSDDIVGVDKIKNGLKSPLDSEGNGGEDDIATVWATLGLHPVAPCSNLFRLAEPKLRYARLRVFEKNGSDNILRLRVVNGVVDRVFLNGKEIVNRTVRRSDLFKGGELLFERAVH